MHRLKGSSKPARICKLLAAAACNVAVALAAVALPVRPASATGAITAAQRAAIEAGLAQLPPADMALVLHAVAKLPSAKRQVLIVRLRQLKSGEQAVLVKSLAGELANLAPVQRQALVDELFGAGNPAERAKVAVVASQGLDAFGQALGNLPAEIGNADPGLETFLDQLFQTFAPHVQGLVAASLAKLPVAARPLVLEEDLSTMQKIEPTAVLDTLWAMADQQSVTLLGEAEYEASYNCSQAPIFGNCSPELQAIWEAVLNGLLPALQPAPLIDQGDVSDCVLTPVCPAQERQVVINYLEVLQENSQSEAALVNALVARVQATNTEIASSWVGLGA